MRLIWDPQANGVSIAFRDKRANHSAAFGAAAAYALDAFRHPYA